MIIALLFPTLSHRTYQEEWIPGTAPREEKRSMFAF
jgi:hypothetical protein